MLTVFAKILKILNSETEPFQISLALCLAMIAGLTPVWRLHNLVVLLIVFVLRANLTTFMLAWIGFSGMAYVLDPLFHALGLQILTSPSFQNLWTSLYNTSLGRLSNFNNSILMGSLVFSLALFVPLFLVSRLMIYRYREHLLSWIEKSRIVQALKASKFFHIYRSVSDWGGLS